MIDRIKGGIEPENVKEMWPGAIESLKAQRIKNPHNKPVVSYHSKKQQVVFDVAAPRCLFGNNLAEATDGDLDKLVSAIQCEFTRNGLDVPKEAIYNAQIYYLEYGKNIILPITTSMTALFKRFGKGSTKGYNVLEFHHYRKDRRDGYKVGISLDNRDIAFYDKTTKEIVGKSLYNKENKEIYGKLLEQGKQVLRYESSFYGSSSVNANLSKFKQCGGKFTLREVWDSKLARELLVSFSNEVLNNLPPAGCSKEAELRQIKEAIRGGVSISNILIYKGLESLEKKLGANTVKEMFNPIEERYAGGKKQYMQYSAAKNKQEKLAEYFKTKRDQTIRKIKRTIKDFKPIRVDMRTQEIIDY